jgi:hypothetical protein
VYLAYPCVPSASHATWHRVGIKYIFVRCKDGCIVRYVNVKQVRSKKRDKGKIKLWVLNLSPMQNTLSTALLYNIRLSHKTRMCTN